MTLVQLIGRIEAVAASQPAINCIVRNDIFTLSTRADARYGVFAWVQRTHRTGQEGFNNFSLVLYYVDRLTEDEGNRLEIQSTGIQVIGNIVRTLEEEGIESSGVTYTTFSQRFLDSCAGVYAEVTFEVPEGGTCEDTYTGDGDVLIIK